MILVVVVVFSFCNVLSLASDARRIASSLAADTFETTDETIERSTAAYQHNLGSTADADVRYDSGYAVQDRDMLTHSCLPTTLAPAPDRLLRQNQHNAGSDGCATA